MQDLLSKIALDGNGAFRKIKGHTKIELTSAKTGAKRVVEHDNTFQASVLADYMRSMGCYNNNPFANDTWAAANIYENLVGGILLFRNTIAEGTKYMPAGNVMIANGSMGIASTGTPSELGSFNETESAVTANSVTFVYDWGTSQGNGEISSVCLTSNKGGLIGYGNTSGAAYETPASICGDQNSRGWENIAPYGNMGYSFTLDNANLTLTVTKKRMPITQGSVLDLSAPATTVQITYTEAMTYSNCVGEYIGDGKFVIFPTYYDYVRSESLNAGATYKFLIYDATDDSVVVGKFTNPESSSIRLYYGIAEYTSDGGYLINLSIVGNYAYYTNTSTGALYKIDWSTGEVVDTVTLSNAPKYAAGAPRTFGRLSPGLFMYPGSDPEVLVIYDPVNSTYLPTNASRVISGGSYGQTAWRYNESIDALTNPGLGEVYSSRYSDPSSPAMSCVYKNPLYLATINNLDSPVTKDATMTMKVTYSLTESV